MRGEAKINCQGSGSSVSSGCSGSPVCRAAAATASHGGDCSRPPRRQRRDLDGALGDDLELAVGAFDREVLDVLPK